MNKSTLYKTVKRLHERGHVVRKRRSPPRGRWFYVYQATKAGQVRLIEGGQPRGAEKKETREIDVLVDNLNDILDTDRIKFESRHVTFVLDPFQTKVLRDACPHKEKKRDRASQRVYSNDAFTVTIPHTGNAQVTLKDWRSWDKSMIEWMQRAGLSKETSRTILKQIWNQIPGGTTRAEIPVLEQAMRRLQVQCDVVTRLKNKAGEIYGEVESNINYSLNEIGLEYFGTTRWVDAIIRVLIGLQHTTLVSEASRDNWIEDALEAVEKLRKEREKIRELVTEKEKRKTEKPNYYV